jgi:hypothetical protein
MKRNFICAVIFLIFAFAISLALTQARGASAIQSGEQWEYLVVAGGSVNLSPPTHENMRKEPGPFSREAFPLETNMDKLGTKGWELVSVSGSAADPVLFFKRRR